MNKTIYLPAVAIIITACTSMRAGSDPKATLMAQCESDRETAHCECTVNAMADNLSSEAVNAIANALEAGNTNFANALSTTDRMEFTKVLPLLFACPSPEPEKATDELQYPQDGD